MGSKGFKGDCYLCGEYGHSQSFCPRNPKAKGNGKNGKLGKGKDSWTRRKGYPGKGAYNLKSGAGKYQEQYYPQQQCRQCAESAYDQSSQQRGLLAMMFEKCSPGCGCGIPPPDEVNEHEDEDEPEYEEVPEYKKMMVGCATKPIAHSYTEVTAAATATAKERSPEVLSGWQVPARF